MKLFHKIKSKILPNKEKLYDSLERAWDIMGEKEPFYSVITNEEFKSENLSSEVIDQFYSSASAQANTQYVAEKLKDLKALSLKDFHDKRALDFGCGVGRNALHLAPHFKTLVGLDISEKHLMRAREICEKKGILNTEFYKSTHEITSFGKFDFIFSVITLQHIPPPLMKQYIHQLLSMLNPKGLAFLQFPIEAEGYKFLENKFITEKGNEKHWDMHILPENEARKIISKEDCTLLEIDLTAGNQCGGKWKGAYFIIEKK